MMYTAVQLRTCCKEPIGHLPSQHHQVDACASALPQLIQPLPLLLLLLSKLHCTTPNSNTWCGFAQPAHLPSQHYQVDACTSAVPQILLYVPQLRRQLLLLCRQRLQLIREGQQTQL
jgi:hypothetical protein